MNKEVLYMDLDGLLITLDVVQEEQTAIKRKLSGLLDNVVSTPFINWAEDIHQQILNREAAVQLLRKDIIALKKSIVQKKIDYVFKEELSFALWRLVCVSTQSHAAGRPSH